MWRTALDPPAERMAELVATLSTDERTRAAAFRFERDRRAYMVARGALRTLIGRYARCDPRDATFAYGPRGKPSLHSPQAPVCFNVSHSGELALLAFSAHSELGVDVEKKRTLSDLVGLAQSVFSPRELAVVQTLSEPPVRARRRSDAFELGGANHDAFFRCWTRKEAFIKATGEGLGRSLQSFDVSLSENEPAQLQRVDSDLFPSRWSMSELPIDAGYAAALVVDGQGLKVRLFSFS